MNEGGGVEGWGGRKTQQHGMKVYWRCLHPLIHVRLHRLVRSVCVFQSNQDNEAKCFFVKQKAVRWRND